MFWLVDWEHMTNFIPQTNYNQVVRCFDPKEPSWTWPNGSKNIYEISILKVVSTTPSPEKVYPMKFYVIKFVSDLHGSVFFLSDKVCQWLAAG
jgi:hypothetical protein